MTGRTMEFGIKITADGKVAVSEVNKTRVALADVGSTAQTTGRQTDALSASLWKLAAPLAAVAGSLAMGPQLVSVQREFDKINTSLITVTGSVAKAEQAFAVLSAFAARTPFSLQEVSNAFIKLRALGLEPSERALTSYGNTASAMGKSLNQMIEAVADAATGEMERLKEFGIKSKQEGDKVAFTFQGVTTTIGNSAAEIERYLMGLGETQFAGAMERQAATLDGAISNLGDSWSQLMLTISRQGPGDLIHDSVRMASGSLGDLSAIIRELGRAQDAATESAGRFAGAQDALRTVFEAITIGGANVSFVFKTLGMEIGAWAAQIGALGRGDLAGFRAISDAVKADAERARAELDALERRILNPLKQLSGPSILDARDLHLAAGALDSIATGTAKAGKAAKEAKDEYAALMARISGKDAGLDTTYWRDLATLHKQYLKTGDVDAYRAAVAALTMQQKFYGDATKAAAAEEKLWVDATNKATQEAEKQLQSLEDKARALEDEVRYYGMTEGAIQRTIIARLEEQKRMNDGLDEYDEHNARLDAEIEKRKRLAAAADSKVALDANKAATDQMQKDWERMHEQLGQSLTDELMRGGKDAGELLKNYFKTLVLRPVIQGVVNTGLNAIGMGPSSGIGGSSSLLGTASNANSLFGGGGSLYSSFALSGVGQSLGLSQSIGSMGLLAEDAAFFSSFGGGSMMTGLGSTIGTALPYIGAALAAISMFSKKSTPHAGATAYSGGMGYDTPRSREAIDAYYTGSYFGGQSAPYMTESDWTSRWSQSTADALGPAAEGAAKTINDILVANGLAGGYKVGLAFSADGEDPVRARTSVIDAAGNQVAWDKDWNKFGKDSQKGLERMLTQQVPQVMLTALEAVDLNSLADTYLDSLDISKLSADMAQQAIGFVDSSDEIIAAFEKVGFSADDVTYDLIKAMGGFDAAGAAINEMAQQLDAIAQASASASAMFADSIRTVQMDVLDDQGKYAFLDEEAARYRDVLSSLTDPTAISEYAEKLNSSIMQAWGLLDDGQKQSTSEQYVSLLRQADELAIQRYDAAEANAKAQAQELAAAVKAAVAEAMAANVAASGALTAAVNNGIRVDSHVTVDVINTEAEVAYVGGG